MSDNRKSAIAAALILLFFGTGWIVMPRIMLAVGSVSTAAAGVIAVLFIALFFIIFWLRSRSQNRRRN